MQYPPCKLCQCAAISYLNDATNPTPHASLSSTRAAGTPWFDEYTACQSRPYENLMSLPYFFLHQQKTCPLPFSKLPIVLKSHHSVAWHSQHCWSFGIFRRYLRELREYFPSSTRSYFGTNAKLAYFPRRCVSIRKRRWAQQCKTYTFGYEKVVTVKPGMVVIAVAFQIIAT